MPLRNENYDGPPPEEPEKDPILRRGYRKGGVLKEAENSIFNAEESQDDDVQSPDR